MSSFSEMKKRYRNVGSIGQQIKNSSDFAMEETWFNDPQAKRAYIYDYFHDDQPDKKDHMTYEYTTKTPVDVKFVVKSYQSVDKDQVEYYLQFRPSQKFEFEEGDDLYYFETDYMNRYKVEFPLGAYVDLADDRGIYHKWIIVDSEYANQFRKYLILPCDYQLTWIEKNGQNRIKRKMWTILRNQNSYTIGEYRDRYFSHPDNQNKIWMPLNKFTEKFWYNDDTSKTMRLVISAPTEHPIVWSVTKIENTKPFGLQKLTIYQNFWNEHTDYIERDSDGNIIGMYANYFDSEVLPEDTTSLTQDEPYHSSKIVASSNIIKVGGGYKLLTAKLFDDSNEDISERYSNSIFSWSCSIDGEDVTEKVTWYNQPIFNQIKIKFPNEKSYLGKILKIQCTIPAEKKDITISGNFELSA